MMVLKLWAEWGVQFARHVGGIPVNRSLYVIIHILTDVVQAIGPDLFY